MSDDEDDGDDDDLHGRQLLILLAFFSSFGGLLLMIAWITRPNWLWDAPWVAFAAAGLACYPARFLVERFDWWKRLEEPTEWTKTRRDRALRRELATARPRRAAGRRTRRFSWLTALRMVVGGLLTLASLAIIPAGISAGRDNQRVAEAGPVQQATVLAVKVDKWSRNHDVTIKVARAGDRRAVEISGGDDLRPLPKVGDQIPVVVDPDNPSNVLAADADWTMHWYWYVLIVVTALICAGLSLFFVLP